MTKLTLSMGFNSDSPIFELCVKQEIASDVPGVDHSRVVPMMSLHMSAKDIGDVQTAINTINKFSLYPEEEKANAEGPIV